MTPASEGDVIPHALPPADIPYRIAWRSRSTKAGMQRSRLSGASGRFRDHASLFDHPDPRRIDVRRSIIDPFDALHVRRFEHSGRIDVILILDISGSMSFEGHTKKTSLAAQLSGVLARSARRIGDRFGFSASTGISGHALHFSPSRSRAGEEEMIEAIGAIPASGSGVDGLLQAIALLGTKRSLVFLVSDFQFPADDVRRVFDVLLAHDVVPILVRDSAEIESMPTYGFLLLEDLETGRQRVVVMRPSLKAAWLAHDRSQRAALIGLAAEHGWRMLEISDHIDWDRLASHLAGGS